MDALYIYNSYKADTKKDLIKENKKLCGMETVNTKPASVSSFRNIKTTDVCC